MEIHIGVTHAPRELEVDLGDKADAEAVVAEIEKALATPEGMLWLTDRKGRRVGVPSSKVAYVEVAPAGDAPRVGFGMSGVAASK